MRFEVDEQKNNFPRVSGTVIAIFVQTLGAAWWGGSTTSTLQNLQAQVIQLSTRLEAAYSVGEATKDAALIAEKFRALEARLAKLEAR